MTSPDEIRWDKPIKLVGEGRIADGHLRCIYEGYCRYTVSIDTPTGTFEETARDAFAALVNIRTELEHLGMRPAVEGACLDVYPSGMQRDGAGAVRSYRWPENGRPYSLNTFAEIPTSEYDRLASVSEQRQHYDESLRRRNG